MKRSYVFEPIPMGEGFGGQGMGINLEQNFLSARLIAIARGLSGKPLEKIAEALYQGGIKLMEVTVNSPNALESITGLRALYEGRMHIGAGTVTDLDAAKEVIAAGAEFIITPNINQEVIEYCIQKGRLIMPGALTPTEIALAVRCGCRYIKIFPANAMSPGYLKDICAPFDQTRFIAVGGDYNS